LNRNISATASKENLNVRKNPNSNTRYIDPPANFHIDFKLLDKIHSFLKQFLRNLHLIKTRYFSGNLSISWSLQVPCFDKLKIMHNTEWTLAAGVENTHCKHQRLGQL
jgi:hypothetical protein